MNIFLHGGGKCGIFYERLLEELSPKYFAHTYSAYGGKPSFKCGGCKVESIFLDEDPEICFSKLQDCVPLDKDIIKKMEPYEATAMEVLYRWRNSCGAGDSYRGMRSFYLKSLRYWNDFVMNRKINLYMAPDIPHAFIGYLVYALCKAREIPTVIARQMPMLHGQMPNMYCSKDFENIHDDFRAQYCENKTAYKNAAFEEIPLPESLKNYFSAYTGKKTRKKSGAVVATGRHKSVLKLGLERINVYLRQKKYGILLGKGKKLVKMYTEQRDLLRYVESLEQSYNPQSKDKFVFFPLHLQPEATTCPNAGLYADMELVAILVARALPQGVKLYIKEHPAYWMKAERYDLMTESRSKQFYKNLSSIPNVMLIEHKVSSSALIDGASAIVTVNGTAGWESILLGKPVVMFGNEFYAHLDGVYKVETLEECAFALEEIMTDRWVGISKRDIAIYLKTFEDILINANYDYKFLQEIGSDFLNEDENYTAVATGMSAFARKVYFKEEKTC